MLTNSLLAILAGASLSLLTGVAASNAVVNYDKEIKVDVHWTDQRPDMGEGRSPPGGFNVWGDQNYANDPLYFDVTGTNGQMHKVSAVALSAWHIARAVTLLLAQVFRAPTRIFVTKREWDKGENRNKGAS